MLGEKLVWIEWFVCALHLPPFATFELAINNLDYIVAYRGETIVCLFNTLRVYLVWRILAEWVLSYLPKRHTVSLFASVKLGKTFALKKLLNGWHSITCIIVLWGLSILFLAYWLRCAEVTSCLFKSATHPSCLSVKPPLLLPPPWPQLIALSIDSRRCHKSLESLLPTQILYSKHSAVSRESRGREAEQTQKTPEP